MLTMNSSYTFSIILLPPNCRLFSATATVLVCIFSGRKSARNIRICLATRCKSYSTIVLGSNNHILPKGWMQTSNTFSKCLLWKPCFLRMLAAQKTFLKAQNGMNVLSHKIHCFISPLCVLSVLFIIVRWYHNILYSFVKFFFSQIFVFSIILNCNIK